MEADGGDSVDQAFYTLMGAAVGAVAGVGGGIGLEMFKRRSDRQSAALAIAGAIETELWAIRRRGHVQMFEQQLRLIEAGEPRRFFGFVKEEQARNHIADAYIDKYGTLGGELPATVIRFFQTMWALRIDVSRLVSGSFGDDTALIAHIIRQNLEIMVETEAFGLKLVDELRRSAGYRNRPTAYMSTAS